MILKILCYFFLIFGIVEFLIMLYQSVFDCKNTENMLIILKTKEKRHNTYKVIKKLPLNIYVLSNEEITDINTAMIEKHTEEL